MLIIIINRTLHSSINIKSLSNNLISIGCAKTDMKIYKSTCVCAIVLKCDLRHRCKGIIILCDNKNWFMPLYTHWDTKHRTHRWYNLFLTTVKCFIHSKRVPYTPFINKILQQPLQVWIIKELLFGFVHFIRSFYNENSLKI